MSNSSRRWLLVLLLGAIGIGLYLFNPDRKSDYYLEENIALLLAFEACLVSSWLLERAAFVPEVMLRRSRCYALVGVASLFVPIQLGIFYWGVPPMHLPGAPIVLLLCLLMLLVAPIPLLASLFHSPASRSIARGAFHPLGYWAVSLAVLIDYGVWIAGA